MSIHSHTDRPVDDTPDRGLGSGNDGARRLRQLLRTHDALAQRVVELASHDLPEEAEAVALMVAVEEQLQASFPTAYDAMLPVWLTRHTAAVHAPGQHNAYCTICTRAPSTRVPSAA